MAITHRKLGLATAAASCLVLSGCGGSDTDRAVDDPITPSSSQSTNDTGAPGTVPPSATPRAPHDSSSPTTTAVGGRTSSSVPGATDSWSLSTRPSSASSTTRPTQTTRRPSIRPSTRPPSIRPSVRPSGSTTRRLKWVPYGPASPLSPTPPMRAYASLQSTCAMPSESWRTTAERTFWSAAIHVCHALKQRSDSEWQAAVADWTTGRGFGDGGCIVGTVRKLMTTVMGASPDPRVRPAIVLDGTAPGFACTPRAESITPAHGVPGTEITAKYSGAQWLTFTGRWTLGPIKLSPTGQEFGDHTTLSVPDGLTGNQRLVLTFEDGQRLDFGMFTYD